MAGFPESTRQSISPRKRVASIVFLVFSVAFLALGSVGLGLRSAGSLGGSEWVVGGSMGIAIGCFFFLAFVALHYNKSWLGQWN